MADRPIPAASGHDVFISYAHTERNRIEPIVKSLERVGFSVWFDAHLEPGDIFRDEINAALRAARAVLVVWTRTSVERPWVRSEAALGFKLGILIPILLEHCEPPMPFGEMNIEDFSTWIPDSQEHNGWNKVLGKVRELCGRGDAIRRWNSLGTVPSVHDLQKFIAEFPTDTLAIVARSRLEEAKSEVDVPAVHKEGDHHSATLPRSTQSKLIPPLFGVIVVFLAVAFFSSYLEIWKSKRDDKASTASPMAIAYLLLEEGFPDSESARRKFLDVGPSFPGSRVVYLSPVDGQQPYAILVGAFQSRADLDTARKSATIMGVPTKISYEIPREVIEGPKGASPP